MSTPFSDPFLTNFPYVVDADLHLSIGFAYQHTLADLVEYGEDYFEKYISYENTQVAKCLNAFRRDFAGRYGPKAVLDVGVGSLEFLKSIAWRKRYGYDVNPVAVKALQDRGLFIDLEHEDIPEDVGVVTLWDVLEHMTNPTEFLQKIPTGVKVCVSIPIFTHLNEIRESKHYRPGEHLVYWTDAGIKSYFASQGFTLEAESDQETACGRESIKSYRFLKVES